MASAATWNVFRLATTIGWPFQLPYHTRTGTESVISRETIDQLPPDPLTQEIAVVCGQVTLDPAEDAALCVENAVPPETYPDPVISVPDAEPVDAVDVSLSFIALAPRDSAVPGTPAAPVGSVALSILLDIAASIAVCAMAQAPSAETGWTLVDPGMTVIVRARHPVQSSRSMWQCPPGQASGSCPASSGCTEARAPFHVPHFPGGSGQAP